jgi:uncharacterized protein (UPF0276 family)
MARLLSEGAVDCDSLKCPEWEGVVAAARPLRPVHVHFDIVVGNGGFDHLDFALIRRLLASTDTTHLNCHLMSSSDAELSSPADKKRLVESWVAGMEYLKAQVPGCPLVAENLPFIPGYYSSEIAASPDLITQALKEADAGLLFDLSHARISSHYLGSSIKDYAARLPMDRLAELHITGLRYYRGYLSDHFEMSPEDWDAARWARAQIKTGIWREPDITAFEYGGVGEVFGWRTHDWVLREQVPRLSELFG